MPLTDSAPRRLMHTRSVQCYGYEREDGLWDIEAHLIDTKTHDLPNSDRGGTIKAGEPLHGMWVRLTVDMDFLIHHAEASIDWSPFNICPQITHHYKRLVGLHIGAGWNRKVKELFSGVHGCTHLTELLGPMATTAYQSIHHQRERRENTKPHRKPPHILNTCHALARDSEVVRVHWPQFYTGKDDQVANG